MSTQANSPFTVTGVTVSLSIRHTNADRLQQRGLFAQTSQFEYARREIENRVNAGELVEESDEKSERNRLAKL